MAYCCSPVGWGTSRELSPDNVHYSTSGSIVIALFDFRLARCIIPPFTKEMLLFEKLSNDKLSLLHAAAEGSKVDVIKLLLSAGANVNYQSRWSITPLISALLHLYKEQRPPCRMTLICLIDSGAMFTTEMLMERPP